MYFVFLLYSDGYKMSKRLISYMDPTSGSRGLSLRVHTPLSTLLNSAYMPLSVY